MFYPRQGNLQICLLLWQLSHTHTLCLFVICGEPKNFRAGGAFYQFQQLARTFGPPPARLFSSGHGGKDFFSVWSSSQEEPRMEVPVGI
jgi:hypothetical protein